MKKLFIALTVILNVGMSCQKKEDPKPDFVTGWNENITLVVGDQTRYVRIYKPVDLPQSAPVVILLHGGSQSMTDLFSTSAGGTRMWTTVADAEKFLLVVPNGSDANGVNNGNNQNWNDCRSLTSANPGFSGANDVAFIRDLIEWTKKSFDVDEKRFYVTGVSNGGMMCYRLATELTSKIAAAAAFIANVPSPSECPGSPPSPMPMMICVGTADPLMPYLGGNVSGTGRGSVLSTAESLNVWLAFNGLSAADGVTSSLPNLNTTDNSTITKRSFGAATPAKEVELYIVVGGGHCMPSIANPISAASEAFIGAQNKDIEGAQLAWDFLKRHTRN